MKEAIDHTAGIKRLGRMMGLRSLRRNLAVEDREFELEIQANQKDWHGENYDMSQDGGQDEMEIFAGGDVTVNYGQGENDQPEQPPKSTASKLLPYALAAALGTGLGGLGVYKMLPKPKPSDAVDTLMEYNVGFGTPENINDQQ